MHLESAAAARDKFNLCMGIRRLELRRQTGGAGLVVSKRAVLDAQLHIVALELGLRDLHAREIGEDADNRILLRDHALEGVELVLVLDLNLPQLVEGGAEFVEELSGLHVRLRRNARDAHHGKHQGGQTTDR